MGLNLQSASFLINLDIPWNPAVLEQRIARIHRIGQHKPVNIINFISKGTIEENLLGLIKFKKSVFEGVLDNGENIVFMGESKLKQFMNSVAKAVEPTVQTQEPLSAEPFMSGALTTDTENPPPMFKGSMGGLLSDETPAAPMESEDNEVSSETTALGRNDVNDLIKTGISFLEKLSTSLSDGKSLQPLLSSFVEKDKDTGKTFLKIPVPDEDIINKAVNLFKRDTAGVEKVGMMKGKLFRMRDHL